MTAIHLIHDLMLADSAEVVDFTTTEELLTSCRQQVEDVL